MPDIPGSEIRTNHAAPKVTSTVCAHAGRLAGVFALEAQHTAQYHGGQQADDE